MPGVTLFKRARGSLKPRINDIPAGELPQLWAGPRGLKRSRIKRWQVFIEGTSTARAQERKNDKPKVVGSGEGRLALQAGGNSVEFYTNVLNRVLDRRNGASRSEADSVLR